MVVANRPSTVEIPLTIAGDFVYHCHLLEHEDGGTMARITDGTANRVDLDKTAHDSADPDILHVALGPLSSGGYKIVWCAVAVGHAMTGTLAFTVAP